MTTTISPTAAATAVREQVLEARKQFNGLRGAFPMEAQKTFRQSLAGIAAACGDFRDMFGDEVGDAADAAFLEATGHEPRTFDAMV